MPQNITPIRLVQPAQAIRLVDGEHSEPHGVLGAHPARTDGKTGAVIRAFHPDAVAVEILRAGHEPAPMHAVWPGGLFELFLAGAGLPLVYGLRFRSVAGRVWEQDDAYRFLPSLGDVDLHLFNEGSHRRLWECLGAHVREIDGVRGVAFAVWAPNAMRVSVVGAFCGWDGRIYPMRQMGSSGVFELFIPGIQPGELYKYEIKTKERKILLKTDPCAAMMEIPPGTASRVYDSKYAWEDDVWMQRRARHDLRTSPMAIYEVHWGSWHWTDDGTRPLSYREMAPRLIEHVERFGFTHIEIMPISEHPFGGSWGYQTTGYYAPTSRYGTPDDFRYFVDQCHQHGIGVLLDWVPAHFPKDSFALARFDGTALYEHDESQRSEHPDWGTLIFNFGRTEVRNFLIASALCWLKDFHVDGLRVDAVASMLYLDYSRDDGDWTPNKYGGREDLDAIDFLKQLNEIVHAEVPGAITIAEESTAWSGVTRPVRDGGLGFTFKWNMGWMHDTLEYFSKEPVHRKFHHAEITFAMLYEYSEYYIMPLSHDEVVHGKQALLEKMPGDLWQKFANLRVLLAYQYTRPGKILLFQGAELAPWYEWFHEAPLNWSLANDPERAGLQRFLEDLGRLYHATPAFWKLDHDPAGFQWIDSNDRENSVLTYCRCDGKTFVVVVINLTPVPRENYRIGVPAAGAYRLCLNSDDPRYGGSGHKHALEPSSEATVMHGRNHSLVLTLPPLSVSAYEWAGGRSY